MANLEFRSDVSMQDGGVAKIVSFYLTQKECNSPSDYLPARAVDYQMLPFNGIVPGEAAQRRGLRVDFDPSVAFEKPAPLLVFGSDPLQWCVTAYVS